MSAPLKLLIIGGTKFVGRHITETALKRGHDVTLFNRGISNNALFPQVKKLKGDREKGDVAALENKSWDIVVDVCGYRPEDIRPLAKALSANVGRYLFVSTISVYKDFTISGINEDYPLSVMPEKSGRDITRETYGPMKVLCEKEVAEIYPNRHLIIRPGLIAGPYDPTDRLTYWVHRILEGGQVLVPAPPERPMQFIDARDLAEWILDMAEKDTAGIYHATGPAQALTMKDFLVECKRLSSQETENVWVEEKYLQESGIEPWQELPLWHPAEEFKHLMQIDISRALSQGLKYRPLVQTLRDTIAWASMRPLDYQWQAGLSSDKEARILREWLRRKGK